MAVPAAARLSTRWIPTLAIILLSRADRSSSELGTCVLQLPQCLDILLESSDEEPEKDQQRERLAQQLLQSWLQGISDEQSQTARVEALEHLLRMASVVREQPSLALGIGQALHSYFYWGLQNSTGPAESKDISGFDWPKGPSEQVLSVVLDLHEIAVNFGGCSSEDTEVLRFLSWKCPWRWRFVMLVGSELGLHLAHTQKFRLAAGQLNRAANHMETMQKLPFFKDQGFKPEGPMSINQNWDYFPDAQHWPIWPREMWPSFAHFLEEHHETFKQSLESLLKNDPEGKRFAFAAQFQNGLTPRTMDWSRLKIIHSGGMSDLCNEPYMKDSCKALASRPEIGAKCGTYLSGASFARLAPGAELKSHFGSHPRLTVHLGLRIPIGGSLTVGGKDELWHEGSAVVFDDTYMHKVRNRGVLPRYVLVAWFCHPCDLGWRASLIQDWQVANPLPPWCGSGGPGYSRPPVPGYGDTA